MSFSKKIFLLFASFLLLFQTKGNAHAADLVGLPTEDIVYLYLKLGFTHIIPLGLDHILFVVCLFFLSPKLKPLIWQATAFTVAHTITLGLAIYGAIDPPSHIVEPVIALSIMFVAIENIITDQLKPSRILMVFIFGLIHGMGFASVLTDLGLPEDKFLISLITFNAGVELGQICIIVFLWLVVGRLFSKKVWYRKLIVIPTSTVIALISLYWLVERVFFI
jgi:HupE / UreJ protein